MAAHRRKQIEKPEAAKPKTVLEKWILEALDISTCFTGGDDKTTDFDLLELQKQQQRVQTKK